MSKQKVLAAMSGGVDSSVTVKLLLDMGYEVAGATMHLYDNEDIGLDREKTCCSLSDVEDARSVALRLGIDHYVFNFKEEFARFVIDDFVSSYLKGETPNPCIQCNIHLKFDSFLHRARLLGFDKIATGHYVTKEYDKGAERWLLKCSPDPNKDQSYVLYALTQDQLSATLFPVGEMSKEHIREIAQDNQLVNSHKPDSQDICFIPDGNYADFIISRAGQQPEGDIILTDNTFLGRHKGLIHYTIGQRRGVGVSYSEPLFVAKKDLASNTLIMGTADQIRTKSLMAEKLNYIAFDPPQKPFRCTARTRYHQRSAPCTVTPLDGARAIVEFHQPHSAVSPGQSVVFYDGDYVLGGGKISFQIDN